MRIVASESRYGAVRLESILVPLHFLLLFAACGGPALGPLNTAASTGDIQTVRRLLDTGTDVNATTNDRSPLRAASCAGETEIVKYLLSKGADPNSPNDRGGTALICASFRCHHDVVKALLDAGVRVDEPFGEQLTTALMQASQTGNASVVRILLESGANPNLIDVWGGTALHRAAYFGSSDITRMLVEAGAKTSVHLSSSPPRSKDSLPGDTPLSIAKRKGFNAVVEFLRKRGVTE